MNSGIPYIRQAREWLIPWYGADPGVDPAMVAHMSRSLVERLPELTIDPNWRRKIRALHDLRDLYDTLAETTQKQRAVQQLQNRIEKEPQNAELRQMLATQRDELSALRSKLRLKLDALRKGMVDVDLRNLPTAALAQVARSAPRVQSASPLTLGYRLMQDDTLGRVLGTVADLGLPLGAGITLYGLLRKLLSRRRKRVIRGPGGTEIELEPQEPNLSPYLTAGLLAIVAPHLAEAGYAYYLGRQLKGRTSRALEQAARTLRTRFDEPAFADFVATPTRRIEEMINQVLKSPAGQQGPAQQPASRTQTGAGQKGQAQGTGTQGTGTQGTGTQGTGTQRTDVQANMREQAEKVRKILKRILGGVNEWLPATGK